MLKNMLIFKQIKRLGRKYIFAVLRLKKDKKGEL
jgi:hypothetical protein